MQGGGELAAGTVAVACCCAQGQSWGEHNPTQCSVGTSHDHGPSSLARLRFRGGAVFKFGLAFPSGGRGTQGWSTTTTTTTSYRQSQACPPPDQHSDSQCVCVGLPIANKLLCNSVHIAFPFCLRVAIRAPLPVLSACGCLSFEKTTIQTPASHASSRASK